MGQASRAVRKTALEMARPLVSGHVRLLTGNAAARRGMEELFVDAGADAARSCLADKNLVPIAQLNSAGGYQCE
jgi:hypothetical protein